MRLTAWCMKISDFIYSQMWHAVYLCMRIHYVTMLAQFCPNLLSKAFFTLLVTLHLECTPEYISGSEKIIKMRQFQIIYFFQKE